MEIFFRIFVAFLECMNFTLTFNLLTLPETRELCNMVFKIPIQLHYGGSLIALYGASSDKPILFFQCKPL